MTMEALAEVEGISAANVMTKFMILLLKNAYSASDLVAPFLSGTLRQVPLGATLDSELALSVYARTDSLIFLSTKLIAMMSVVRLKNMVKSRRFSILLPHAEWSLLPMQVTRITPLIPAEIRLLVRFEGC